MKTNRCALRTSTNLKNNFFLNFEDSKTLVVFVENVTLAEQNSKFVSNAEDKVPKLIYNDVHGFVRGLLQSVKVFRVS